jgi:hypothetical protein
MVSCKSARHLFSKNDFEVLRKKLNELMFDGDFTPSAELTGRPEGNCNVILH